MKYTVEDLSAVKKILHVEIPEDIVSSELENAYKQINKTAKIKGFRPGKAPRSTLERIYKKDVNADVSSKLIHDSIFKAVEEANLNIVAPPLVDPPEVEDKKIYKYDASVEVYPEIKHIDFKGISLKKSIYAVGEKEIEAQLKMIQKNLATQQPVDDKRPVKEKDFVLIDFEAFEDGKPFSEIKSMENFTLKVGDAVILKEFDDQLVGMNSGDSKEIIVEFPSDYFNAKMANHKVTFKMKLNQIREEVLPEINDEFLKKVGKYSSLDELKDTIRQNLQKGYEQRSEHEINEQIFMALIEKTDFEVPDSLIAMELRGIIEETELSLNYQNMSLKDLGLTEEKLAEKYRDTASKQAKRHLILNKIIAQEKLEINEDEIGNAISDMANTVRQTPDDIKKYYKDNKEKMAFLKNTLLEKKVLRLIIENSTIENVEQGKEANLGS